MKFIILIALVVAIAAGAQKIQSLEPRIHAISDQTHHRIDAPLTPAQLQAAKRFERGAHP